MLKENFFFVESPTHLLVVYSHDCEPHEKVVQKFVEFLTAELPGGTIVDVDFRCANEIAENKHDWMYKTIRSADRILLVHSIGGYMQYHARFAGDSKTAVAVAVERQRPGEFDDLFDYQLEILADRMYDGKILHAHFDYTPAQKFLPFAGAVQRYRLPQHLDELVANLKFVAANNNHHDNGGDPWAPPPVLAENLANSRQLQELHDAVLKMREFQVKFPGWFEATHVKRPLQFVGATPERRLPGQISFGGISGGSQPALNSHPESQTISVPGVDSSTGAYLVGAFPGGAISGGASPATPKRKISNSEISTTSAQSSSGASSGIEDGSSSGGGATNQGAFSGSSPSASERSLNDDAIGATTNQIDSGVYSLRNTRQLLTGDSSTAKTVQIQI